MQIKTMSRFYLTLVRMVIIKNINQKGGWKRAVEGVNSIWSIWCILGTFVNTPMYTHPAQQQ
jgi:hypothetical protein